MGGGNNQRSLPPSIPRLRWDPWARHRTPNCFPGAAAIWLPTAPGVCSLCVCVHYFVCVAHGLVKCRAQIPGMGLHTWPHVTSLSLFTFTFDCVFFPACGDTHKTRIVCLGQAQSLAYEELVRLLLVLWPSSKIGQPGSQKLDKLFLHVRLQSPCRGLPFSPKINPISSDSSAPQLKNCSNIMGLNEQGYGAMPKVEQFFPPSRHHLRRPRGFQTWWLEQSRPWWVKLMRRQVRPVDVVTPRWCYRLTRPTCLRTWLERGGRLCGERDLSGVGPWSFSVLPRKMARAIVHSMAALVDIQYVVKSVWVAWQGQIIPARRSVLTSWPLWWHSTHCCWEVSGGQEAGGIVLAPVLGKVNFKSNAL